MIGFCVVCLVLYTQFNGCFSVNPSDVDILKSFKSQMNFPQSLHSWKGSNPCDDNWAGVLCDPNNNIIGLRLSNFSLNGNIPEELFQMNYLLDLDLSFNYGIYGDMPEIIRNDLPLQYLNVENCSISGNVPVSISLLSNLTFLNLNRNQFTGALPYELRNLTKLYWFDFSYNLLYGPTPDFSLMTNLMHIHLQHNFFNGTLPSSLSSLKNLFHLIVDHNQMVGEIPSEIFSLETLTVLSLNNNNFSPSNISSLLSNANLKNLGDLSLGKTNLVGTFPPTDKIPKIQSLNLSSNHLTGTLPGSSAFDKSEEFSVLDISFNKFHGYIPDLTSTHLNLIDLQNNDFDEINLNLLAHGFLQPPTIFLSGNPLCSKGKLHDLKQICKTEAHSQWSPYTFDDCDETDCKDGFFINPYKYKMNDHECVCSSPLTALLILNHFSLGLFFQSYADSIENIITRQISEDGDVTLHPQQAFVSVFNATPSGYFNLFIQFYPTQKTLSNQTISAIKFSISNHRINLGYGFNSYIFGGYTDPVKIKKRRHILWIYLLSFLIPLVIISILILLACVYREKAIARKEMMEKIERNRFQIQGLKKFSLHEVQNGTHGFDERLVLGEGGYGKVYKMTWRPGDRKEDMELAAKRSFKEKKTTENSSEAALAFYQELKLISRIHHRNLIHLIGYCTDNKEEILIYPFLPYGNLEQHLQGRFLPPLNWNERLNILLGTARAITYLHYNATPPIIHRDIKASNILLDSNINPVVSDFGISLANTPFNPEKNVIKGSEGYLDPEYFESGYATFKSDVYSFGILIIVIITADKPFGYYDMDAKQKPSFPQTIRSIVEIDSVRAIVDPNMSEFPETGLAKLLNLAFQCTEEKGHDRPPMRQVLKEIEEIFEDFADVAFQYGEDMNVNIRQVVHVDEKDWLYGQKLKKSLKENEANSFPERRMANSKPGFREIDLENGSNSKTSSSLFDVDSKVFERRSSSSQSYQYES